jgi:hypothetical protein
LQAADWSFAHQITVDLTIESDSRIGIRKVYIVTLSSFSTSVICLRQKLQLGSSNVAITRDPLPLTILMMS